MSKKQLIIDKTIDVFVAYGFHGSPIAKLIKTVGISNGTFFYYFKTKEDLITAIYKSIKSELYDAIVTAEEKDNVKDQIQYIWFGWVNWATNNMSKFRFLEMFANSPFVNELEKKEVKENYRFIVDILNSGLYNNELVSLDLPLLSEIIYGSIRSAIVYQYKNKDLNQSELSTVFHMLWQSISA